MLLLVRYNLAFDVIKDSRLKVQNSIFLPSASKLISFNLLNIIIFIHRNDQLWSNQLSLWFSFFSSSSYYFSNQRMILRILHHNFLTSLYTYHEEEVKILFSWITCNEDSIFLFLLWKRRVQRLLFISDILTQSTSRGLA